MDNSSFSNPIHKRLTELAAIQAQQGIRELFVQDSQRAKKFSIDFPGLYFDFSKTHITDDLLTSYSDIARSLSFNAKRHALFSGAEINATEQRPVLHTLLRAPDNHGVAMEDPDLISEAQKSATQFRRQYQEISARLASREKPIENIIHVGIGGSSLGTQLLFEALNTRQKAIQIHFLSNIDGHQLAAVLASCELDNTLVIGVSKTFTTAETLQNIRSIGEWYAAQGGEAYLDNVYAVTAAPENALAFGVPQQNTVSFPQWVGGRYSVWSAVSLSATLVLGIAEFERFLAGAATMDAWFLNSDTNQHPSFIAAALDHYYSNYFKAQSRAVFAYDFRLRSLVNYLQQLETESNGKDRQLDGSPVDQFTSPVIWGGVGTDVQHSVFQMLHQGTAMIPAEFILTARPDHDFSAHHQELLANGVAQTAALLAGQDYAQVQKLNSNQALSELALQAKVFTGNRPSTTLIVERLTAENLGALLAFYEHRTFCYGVLCNINSFDQMGVELGKRLAKSIRPMLSPPQHDQEPAAVDSNERLSVLSDLDGSTAEIVTRLKELNS